MALSAANFYKYTGDPKVANKSLGSVVVSSGAIKPLENLSNLSVRLLVNYNSSVMSCNYFEFEGLYYKITDREYTPSSGMQITATLDSLKSYYTQIKECDAVCERSSTKYNSKVNDPLYPVEQRKQVWIKKLFDLPNTDIQVLGYIE